jgi:hypothetical protein
MFGVEFSLKARIPGKVMSEYEEEYDMHKFEEEIQDEILDEAMSEWQQLAAATLGDTAEGYIASMQAGKDSSGGIILMLDDTSSEGKLANMQEKGAGAFDMKPGLLAGNSSRVIPITHGDASGGGANPMPKKTLQKAKLMHMGEREGGRFKDASRRKSNSVTDYKHKNSLYSGMVRPSKAAAKAYGGGFVTFRTVSQNSAPGSFWHPGFEPLDLIEKVKEHITQKFSDILNKARDREY